MSGSHDLIMEAGPANEYQSYSGVEGAVQIVGGVIPTLKLALEHSYSKELEADHCVIPWLSMYEVVVVSMFEVGSDGKTAHENRTRQNYPFSVSTCSIFFCTEHEAFFSGVHGGLSSGTATGCCQSRSDQVKDSARPYCVGTCWTQLWVHHGSRRWVHSEMVTKYQRRGMPLPQAVSRNHRQCGQRCAGDTAEFSAHEKSTSVQVRTSTWIVGSFERRNLKNRWLLCWSSESGDTK